MIHLSMSNYHLLFYMYTIFFEETNVDSQAGQKQNAGRDRPDLPGSPVWVAAPEAWSFFKLLDSEPLAETGFVRLGRGAFHRAGCRWVENAGLTVGGWVELMMGWLVDCFFFRWWKGF